MRIVAGRFRGRTLAAPAHEGLRPTSDRVREALFNVLLHGADAIDLTGAHVLDLFAGTGALGIEALSRGAGSCLFVEEDADARGLIRRNVEAFGLTGVTKIFRRDATRLGPAGPRAPAQLAFLDPPYNRGLATPALHALKDGWLAPGARIVVEEAADCEVEIPDGYRLRDRRTWGGTSAWFLSAEG